MWLCVTVTHLHCFHYPHIVAIVIVIMVYIFAQFGFLVLGLLPVNLIARSDIDTISSYSGQMESRAILFFWLTIENSL